MSNINRLVAGLCMALAPGLALADGNHDTATSAAADATPPGTPAPLAGGGEGNSSTQLGEVVVTAHKRSERAQDVPIAMTTLGQKELQDIGFTNASDLANKVPSLDMAPYPQSSSSLVVFMRGVGQVDAVQLGQEPGVGIYLDDVYLSRGEGLTTDLGDVQRIEVLRGPQGTLYGRNTIGGAVKFVTAGPTGVLGIKESVDVGNFGDLRSATYLNLPEYHDVSAKFSYIRSAFDGWVKNSGESGNFGSHDREGYRAEVRWRPGDKVRVDYAFDHGQQTGVADYEQHQYNFPLFPFNFPLQTDPARQSWRPSTLPLQDNFVSSGHSLTATWSISDSTSLKSITAYRRLDTSQLQDTMEAFNLPSVIASSIQNHEFSQEILLNGRNDEYHLKFNLGAFYFAEGGNQQGTALADTFGLATAMPYVPPTVADLAPPTQNHARAQSSALYADVTWTPPVLDNRLDFDVGGRYSSDTREADRFTPTQDTDTYTSADPTITLSYHWAHDVMSYVRYATAYRSGGYNLSNTDLSAYGPEHLRSWEVGLKSSWWQRRLLFNIDGFVQSYRDIQIDFIEPGVNAGQIATFNAGKQQTRGVESDFVLQPLPGLSLNGNLSYLDTGLITANDPFTGLPQQPYPPPYTSKWAYNAGMEYSFRPFAFGSLSALLGYSHSGKQVTSTANPDDFRPSYDLMNTRLTLSGTPLAGGRLTTALWGNNLTDTKLQFYHTDGAVIFGEPRNYGISFTYTH